MGITRVNMDKQDGYNKLFYLGDTRYTYWFKLNDKYSYLFVISIKNHEKISITEVETFVENLIRELSNNVIHKDCSPMVSLL